MNRQMLELADRIEYGISTEDYYTLHSESGKLAAAALRQCSAVSAVPVAWREEMMGAGKGWYYDEKPWSDQAQPLYAEARPLAEPQASVVSAAQENLREAWSALGLIRETIETLGPVGALQASEHLDGPTFMHEADALVAGIQAMCTEPQTASEDARWAVNVLLEKIAAQFESWHTLDLWRSEAAATVRSFKHDLSPRSQAESAK